MPDTTSILSYCRGLRLTPWSPPQATVGDPAEGDLVTLWSGETSRPEDTEIAQLPGDYRLEERLCGKYARGWVSSQASTVIVWVGGDGGHLFIAVFDGPAGLARGVGMYAEAVGVGS